MTQMFIGYTKKDTGSKYRMLNLHTKRIVLIRNVIWQTKTYGKYVSIQEYTMADNYILRDEEYSNKQAHVKIYPIKTEDFNIEQNKKTKRDYRGKEDVKDLQKTTMTAYIKK